MKTKQRPVGPGARRRGAMTAVEKPKNFKASMKRLIRYLGVHKWTMIIVWALAMASTIFTILGPKILAGATDELVQGMMSKMAGTGGINFIKISHILWLLAGLYLISALFSYAQGYIMAGVSAKRSLKMRGDINRKIHRLPFQYYDKTSQGDVLSRITNDVDTINLTLNQSLTQLVMSVTSLIGILVMMLSISWQMTLAAIAILPFSATVVSFIIAKTQQYFKAQQQSLAQVNGHVEEMLGSHIIVKAFGGEEKSTEQFSHYNEELYASSWKASFFSSLMLPIINFIGNFGYVIICILGATLTVSGRMTIGGIQAFIQYLRQFNQPIAQFAQVSNTLQQTAAAAERVFEFLDEEEEVADRDDALTLAQAEQQGHGINGQVSFDQVTFGYQPEKTIIHQFSAKVSPGQKIAIVGPTGAGKTTIVKLLMRFYDVDSGRITIDGHDIRDFKRDELHKLFAIVLQDTWLFHGTIADNIRYGKLDATDEEVVAAAKAAQAHHFIRTLPGGYDMVVNEEGDNISQGEKQLLTMARAILADPRILILDEATSSVDTRTEVLIQKAIDRLMRGRTSFVIAHRLSTIRNADLILVMRNGDIVEQGTHKELLRQNGFYAELYYSQFDKAS